MAPPSCLQYSIFDIDSGNLYVDCIPILPDNVNTDAKMIC